MTSRNHQKRNEIFICSYCDSQYPKWQGQCLECGKWGTIQKGIEPQKKIQNDSSYAAKTTSLSDVDAGETPRLLTGIAEFDRVVGGGIVPGSLILIGGDPGIGKSTLMLQIALALPEKMLYVSGEESASQVKLRLDRITDKKNTIQFLAEEQVEVIMETIKKEKPSAVIIDSIQTVFTSDVPTEAGQVNQIKASTTKFLSIAKDLNIPIILVGHVTKEGVVAGPKTLEHLVDTVLYLEGDQHHAYRLLRTVKNRFGSTNEVGVFDMQQHGLIEVANPSKMFLSDRIENAAGSVITPVIEGTRAFLVEVQALVTKAVFGYPQRKSSGYDVNRLQLLTAVLQERAGLKLGSHDIHVNIVGGFKIKEPSMDLAVCLAVASAFKNKPFSPRMVAMGEVGLAGEIRGISKIHERIQESERLQFTDAIIPNVDTRGKNKITIHKAKTITEALEVL